MMISKFIRKLMGSAPAILKEEPTLVISELQRTQALKSARSALLSGDHEMLHTCLLPLLQANPGDGDALAIKGFCCYQENNFSQAVVLLQRALACGAQDLQVHKALAAALHKLGQDVEAVREAEKAYEFTPNDPQVMNMLGVAYMNTERFDEAAEMLTQALLKTPKDLAPLRNLLALEWRASAQRRQFAISGKTQQIRQQVMKRLSLTRKKRLLNGEEVLAFIALASAGGELFEEARAEACRLYADAEIGAASAEELSRFFTLTGDLDKAIEMVEFAANESPSLKGLKLGLGLLTIAKGDKRWFSAWQMADEVLLKAYSATAESKVSVWNGERLGKKRLFVYQDQGVGDVLLCLRLLNELKRRGLEFVFWCKPELGCLLATNTGFEQLIFSEDRPDPQAHGCEVAVPLLGLIRTLKIQPKDIESPAFIQASPQRSEVWREKLAHTTKSFRIGVVTTGNPWRYDDWLRSIPPQALDSLKELEGVVWVNLAFDPRPERDALIAAFNMLDPCPDMHDFADTAAVIDNLDAVVAIDCSVAHLALSLKKPTWVLLPTLIDWRWRIGGKWSPWWPEAKVFRSDAPGKWDLAVAELCKSLQSHLQTCRQ